MFVYGEWAEYAFDRYGEKQLEDRFLDKFSGGDWYAGVSSYLAACDEFLTLAEDGKPVRSSPLPAIGIAVASLLPDRVSGVHDPEGTDEVRAQGR